MLEFERDLLKRGYKVIAGCDEAGRGPLAGPVTIASVVMPLDQDKIIEGVNDSKKLTEKQRNDLFDKIIATAIDYKIVDIGTQKIDEINILNATKLGMEECVNLLKVKPDFALIDAVKPLNLNCEYLSIIKGDALSYSIACASILAKVHRDRLMEELDKKYPLYNFKQHKGYGTKQHIELVKNYGLCQEHRLSFVKNIIGEKA